MMGFGAHRAWRDTPLAILGSSLLFADYCAADWASPYHLNPRVTIATGVSDWPEDQRRNTSMVQATTTKQPVLAASFGTRPGITFDGSDDYVRAVLSPTIAVGSRVYVWIAAQWTASPAGNFAGGFTLARSTDGNGMNIMTNASAGAQYGFYNNSLSDGTDSFNNVVSIDTSRHAWETGALSTTTSKFRVDGTGYNGSFTGTLATAVHNWFGFGANLGTGSQNAKLRVHRVVVAHNPASITDLPTAAQIVSMRELMTASLT